MSLVLGIDWDADMAETFADELGDVLFTKTTIGAYSEADPLGAPSNVLTNYAARGLVFGYAQEFVDGERVKQGDYKVTILLATIKTSPAAVLAPGIIPNAGDTVTAAPPNETTAKTGRVVGISSMSQAAVTLQVRGPAL